MARKSYPTDLTDMEWEILAPLIPPTKEGGYPRTTDMREVRNAIYYHRWAFAQFSLTSYQYRFLPMVLLICE